MDLRASLLVTKGIATNGAPGGTTSSKKLLGTSASLLITSAFSNKDATRSISGIATSDNKGIARRGS